MKIVFTPPLDDERRDWPRRLAEALPDHQVVAPGTDDEAARELVDADAVYGWISPEVLPATERLRWMQAPQIAPPPGFYYPALAQHPVVVTNPRGTFDDHIGQHITMFVLALARGLPAYLDAQRARRWDTRARTTRYVDLGQTTVLIVGVGGIGREAARLLQGFGAHILGVDARWEHDVPGVERHGPADLDRVLPDADFVIVTVPHTPETEGMWDAARFRRMKEASFFVNIGRGKTTRLDDLAAALADGHLAGCALDLFEEEPLPADHPLWTMPNVILTPHVASEGATNIRERQFQILLENARRFASDQPLHNVVDKANWF